MLFLEVSLGVAVGIFFGALAVGVLARLHKNPNDVTRQSLEALHRRNELTVITNDILSDLVHAINGKA